MYIQCESHTRGSKTITMNHGSHPPSRKVPHGHMSYEALLLLFLLLLAPTNLLYL